MQVMMIASNRVRMDMRYILHETYKCRMYSRRLLMMGKEVARYDDGFQAEPGWISDPS
jgi:hypothetical protein